MRKVWIAASCVLGFLIILSSGWLSIAPAFRPPSSAFVKKNLDELSKNPADLEFSISTSKTRYMIGEKIPVKFLFKNKSREKYTIETRSYDRSGRFSSVMFFVDGPTDGYADPVFSLVGMSMGGGLGNDKDLQEEERIFILNDYVRFDKPGTYYIYCWSHLVSNKEGLSSPFIKIEIAKPLGLYTYRKTLEACIQSWIPNEETRYEAISRLAYIGSERASDKLISLFGTAGKYRNTDHRIGMAIVACRNWDYARARMEEGLKKPSVLVNSAYVYILSHISIPRDFYFKLNNSYNSDNPIDARAMSEEFFMRFVDYERQYLCILADGLAKRKGENLAAACLVLAKGKDEEGRYYKDILGGTPPCNYPLERKEVKEAVAHSFFKMKEDEQIKLLGNCWDEISSAAIEKPLKELAAKGGRVSKFAGLRLLQLQGKDDEFKRMILDCIKGDVDFDLEPLVFSLKEESIPELDYVLLEKLRSNKCFAPRLIERYASARILPEALEYFKNYKAPQYGGNQPALIPYLMKHDKKMTMDMLGSADLSEPKYYGFEKAMEKYYDAEIETLAIKMLKNTDMNAYASSRLIRMLTKTGSERCIDPILVKLEGFRVTNPGDFIFNDTAFNILKRGDWKLSDVQTEKLCECLSDDKTRNAFKRRLQHQRNSQVERAD
ncbi:MAG: hypothetical protein A2X49_15325 [Lentisphaerae bacterium GWF2_52_8]|nr:MAG: hypothetical protein A2X49_15325 [Lentisphaerae bacterium GWF2_52_8]